MPTLKPGQPTDDTPHEVERTPATELAPGVTLHTRDGAKIGNAIVIKEVPTRDDMADLGRSFMIETDFGNRVPSITEREIDGWFTLGYVSDYHRWCLARQEILGKNVADDFFGDKARRKGR